MNENAQTYDEYYESINLSDDEFFLLCDPGNNIMDSDSSFIRSMITNPIPSIYLKEHTGDSDDKESV